jgi:hypothetical protein
VQFDPVCPIRRGQSCPTLVRSGGSRSSILAIALIGIGAVMMGIQGNRISKHAEQS